MEKTKEQLKISQILHVAADSFLQDPSDLNSGKAYYSCIAVENAIVHLSTEDYYLDLIIKTDKFLCSLGLDTGSTWVFSEFAVGEERQCVRYSWLKFAAMIAEEEGL